jgi:CTP-dependent riboflavin kinase
VRVKGGVVAGVGDVHRRKTKLRDVFTKAAGEELYPGTLNIKIDRETKIKREFRISGAGIDELVLKIKNFSMGNQLV